MTLIAQFSNHCVEAVRRQCDTVRPAVSTSVEKKIIKHSLPRSILFIACCPKLLFRLGLVHSKILQQKRISSEFLLLDGYPSIL